MISTSRDRWKGVAVLGVAMVSVLVGTVAYIASRDPYFHTWRFVGDVDAGVAVLVLGGLIFPVATVLACRVERVGAARASDHFRQCSLLYTAFLLEGLVLLTHRDGSGSLWFAICAAAMAAALIGVFVNAVTLAMRANRAALPDERSSG